MVTLGEAPKQAVARLEFVIIRGSSAYNAILGRPLLAQMKVASSIYHLCMKFPTPNGVGIIRGSQHEGRICYGESVKDTDGLPKRARTEKPQAAEIAPESRVVSTIATGDDLGPRMPEKETNAKPLEELVEIVLDESKQNKKIKIGAELSTGSRADIVDCLRRN